MAQQEERQVELLERQLKRARADAIRAAKLEARREAQEAVVANSQEEAPPIPEELPGPIPEDGGGQQLGALALLSPTDLSLDPLARISPKEERSTIGAQPAAMASDAQQGAGIVDRVGMVGSFPASSRRVITRAGATPPWRRRKREVDPQLLSAAKSELEAEDLARRQTAATAGHMTERQHMR